jgi:hypothetical protein
MNAVLAGARRILLANPANRRPAADPNGVGALPDTTVVKST